MNPQPPKLLDQVRHTLRINHYSHRTEKSYLYWIKRYIFFHNVRHPTEMNSPEIEMSLTHLAVNEQVAPSIQNQALAVLLFLYQQVLGQELESRIEAVRARKSARLPVIMSQIEVKRLISYLPNRYQLWAKVMYGSGLRLMECLRLRVKDIDFEQHQIIVQQGKGNKDRGKLLPESLHNSLKRQLRYARTLHDNDLEQGYGWAELPYALERKYPNANREWGVAVCISFS